MKLMFQLSMRNISHTNLNFHCLCSFTFLEAIIFEQELLCPDFKRYSHMIKCILLQPSVTVFSIDLQQKIILIFISHGKI